MTRTPHTTHLATESHVPGRFVRVRRGRTSDTFPTLSEYAQFCEGVARGGTDTPQTERYSIMVLHWVHTHTHTHSPLLSSWTCFLSSTFHSLRTQGKPTTTGFEVFAFPPLLFSHLLPPPSSPLNFSSLPSPHPQNTMSFTHFSSRHHHFLPFLKERGRVKKTEKREVPKKTYCTRDERTWSSLFSERTGRMHLPCLVFRWERGVAVTHVHLHKKNKKKGKPTNRVYSPRSFSHSASSALSLWRMQNLL